MTDGIDQLSAFDIPEVGPESFRSVGSLLIIDDDQTSLLILRDLLEMSGFLVTAKTDALDAIQAFRRSNFDLVVSDIRMPGLDGLGVLKKIREIDDSTPVVLVTGHGDLNYALEVIRQGAYDFLLKPINLEILINTVRKGVDHCRLKRFERNHRRYLEEQVDSRTRELAETNAFLKGILNSSKSISIILTDFDRKVLFWNAGAENLFGYSAEEMLGKPITVLYPDDHADRIMTELRKVIKAKRGILNTNLKQISKSGRALTIALTVTSMRDESGKVRGILGLGQDVTEQVRLHEELLKSYRRIRRIQGASIFALARLAESRDGETGNHLKRMQSYCKILCDELQNGLYREHMDDQFVEDLIQVSVLHDIGKVGIPDSILFNRSRFEHAEFEIMKQHSAFGGRALEDAAVEAGHRESYLFLARDIAYYHHEKWDGTGYPFGLKGHSIPLGARIVAVADVYDALTTERRYKRAYTHDEARKIIVRERSKHFDPVLVDAFLEGEAHFRMVRADLS